MNKQRLFIQSKHTIKTHCSPSWLVLSYIFTFVWIFYVKISLNKRAISNWMKIVFFSYLNPMNQPQHMFSFVTPNRRYELKLNKTRSLSSDHDVLHIFCGQHYNNWPLSILASRNSFQFYSLSVDTYPYPIHLCGWWLLCLRCD